MIDESRHRPAPGAKPAGGNLCGHRGITHFFKEYKRLNQPEQWAEVVEWQGKKEAKQIIMDAIQRFKQVHTKG